MATTYVSIKELKELGQTQTVGTENKKTLLIPTGQDATGSTNKTISSEGVLASVLDPLSAPISTTYKALPFNPLRGRAVVANSTNTKAYGVRPVDLGQESVGIRKVNQAITYPKEVCNLSNNFTINRFCNITSMKASGSTDILRKQNGILLRVAITFIDIDFGTLDGLSWQGASVIANDFNKYKGKPTLFTIVKKGLIVYCYINNILVLVRTLATNIGNNTEPFTDLAIGTDTDITDIRTDFFNYAFTTSDVSYYWNNGRPDLAIIRDADKWGSNTEITSGTLVVGKRYRIKTFVAGDDFTNVATVTSGTINTSGCEFTCIATTPTTWTNSSELVILGSVADYSPASIADPVIDGALLTSIIAGNPYEVYTAALNSADITGGASPTGATDTAIGTRFVAIRTGALTGSGKVRFLAVTNWEDNSTNARNAVTTTGSPMLVKTQVETTQGQGIANSIRVNNTVSQATASPTIVIDPGRVPEFFSVKNNHLSSSMTIKLGTSAGASDVCTETTITAGKTKSIPCSVIEIDESTSKTLYVTATTVTTYDTTLTTRGAR